MSFTDWLRSELTGLLDLLLPPLCLVCRERSTIHRQTMLCAECDEQLPRYSGARCTCCALPFAATGGSHLCEACLRHRPAFSSIFYHGLYKEQLRDSIQRFKYHDDISLARVLGQLTVSSTAADLHSYDPELIIPVPLHRTRLRQRGYNQALLLARELGELDRYPVTSQGLRRVRPTVTQQGLDAGERRRNVRGAFEVDGEPVRGKRVLLVDDVMTTGATLHECARILRRAGATDVAAAVVARVDREPDMFFE